MLVDSFASGVIGMLCVSNSNLASLRQLAEVRTAPAPPLPHPPTTALRCCRRSEWVWRGVAWRGVAWCGVYIGEEVG